ncbi:host specificity protein J [Pseudomonas sp. PDM13]|uniref:host specificity protein J n=1 Tax=Pseudomonas sp. PDM13 TaxID=2769255 RepID=UPI0021E0D80A|nr:host specificity protein J [Pseudomonas sp. PDM13]MCU9949865.1 host specificity protein J [Pseudomonas sp. PDM13]
MIEFDEYMLAAQGVELHGRKGGESKGRQPVESPDSLRSVAKAKMLLALGEGEFAGQLDGSRIFLDGTPLTDAAGTSNFPGVKWEFRPGSQHQSYIQGMASVENEIAQNVELRSSTPYVRAVTNLQLSAVRLRFRWPALQQQQSNGDVTGYTVAYAIDVQTDGGAYQTVISTAASGKTTSGYERSHRVDLPPATSGWQIRVRRITPNSSTGAVADTMMVTAFTEVIDSKLRYPNTALLYIEFDASQFTNIPQVSCEPRMRIVQVPSNYDAATRTYSGPWDGTFQPAWTDNPAWITYDVITMERFGLGKRVKTWMVDKWELYRIAQYCDQLVPDGQGGQEPRYTCNIYIQSKSEAWTVLRDLAAIYRGMTYWAQGQMVSIADMPRDIDYLYTRANVIDGKFTYSSSSERTRFTRALVSYDNPANGYESDVTAPPPDLALIRRYGVNLLELSAIGCTKESEAQRRGAWALLTNAKDRVVTFQVGLDGQIPMPGYIIGIADPLLAGRPIGGRIGSFQASRQLTLDREPAAKAGDRLLINLPSGRAEARTIEAVVGRVVTVTTAYSEVPQAQLQWSIDADDLAVQQFRVTGIARDDMHLFTITATQHDPNKFEEVDTGARIEDRPITVIPPSHQAPPTDVQIITSSAVSQGLTVTTATIRWVAPEHAVAYDVEWRRDDGDWIKLPRTGNTNVDIVGIYAGAYLARVRAVNVMDVVSVAATSVLTNLDGKVGDPPALASFTATPAVFAMNLRWGFPAGAGDTAHTEIMQNVAASDTGATLLGQYAYPIAEHTLGQLAAGVVLWFKARLVDRLGNVGPWTAWTRGQSSANQDDYDQYFSKRISETALAQALLTKINDGGGAMVAVEQLADALAAMYTIKTQLTVDGRTYMAGIGVGVENDEGVIESQILLAAGRVAIIDPNTGSSSLVSPFVVQNGQVFMNDAVIGNASISFAKITDTLQSDNYVANSRGWRLGKNGEIQLNGQGTGYSLALNNEGFYLTDTTTGVLVVELGVLH